MGETIISLEKIQKSYGKNKVLKGVDLDIHKGDIFGLVGKNGSGKTTIFKIILGLSDYQGGTLKIGEGSLEEGRKKIGFFVGPHYFPYMTGRQNMEYYRRLKNIRDPAETDRILKIVELDHAKGRAGNYSCGMRQRLGIANALLGNPEILILDEPTNGLDPQGIADIRHLVQRLNTEFGMTVVISSHILGELQNTAHRFGIVNNGIVPRVITQEDLSASGNTVHIKVDDLEKAKQALEAAGVRILNEMQDSKSLEDYYFNLVGGENE
jgi:ABC-2 type transport system ATP-binding protein